MPDREPMKTSDALRKVIRACLDDEHTLQHERKFVDSKRAEALTRLAQEREQFVADLERLGDRKQGRPSGSWAELLLEAARDVWVSAAGPNCGDAIGACRHSRARTEERYDEALQKPWPDEIRRVLAAQRRRLHDEASELIQLQ
jgi:hypothetical protein